MSPPIRITEFVVFCLPFLKILVVLGTLVAATAYLFRARSMRGWLRVCVRVGGGILLLPLALCMLVLVSMAACTSRPRIIVSPDSNHIAEYTYQAGFLGRDSTFVSVRKKWSVFPVRAYSYAGPSDWSSTEVRGDVTGKICTRWNERESTWRKSGLCQSRGTSQSKS